MINIFALIAAAIMLAGTITAAKASLSNLSAWQAGTIRIMGILAALFLPNLVLMKLGASLDTPTKTGSYFVCLAFFALLLWGAKRILLGKNNLREQKLND